MAVKTPPTFTIRLEDLRFYSRIGVFEQERKVGNEFKVDCAIETDASSFSPECLDSTISYAEVYDIITEVMDKEWLLLESVAAEISHRCRNRWPSILTIATKITKLAPPISSIQGVASVEYII